MKFLIFFCLFSFVLYVWGGEGFTSDKRIFVVDGKNHVLNENGKLEPAGMVILGDENLGEACVAGKTFDSETVDYDTDKQDFYYTVTNNTNARAVISRTSADKEGLFCVASSEYLESGECLRVYEKDRLQSLASIEVNNEVLCDGWTDQMSKKCIMGRNYEIKPHNLVEIDRDYEYSSTNFNMTVVSTLERTDCK